MRKILLLTAILLANISCQEEVIVPQEGRTKTMQLVEINKQGEIIPVSETNTRNFTKKEGELALQFATEVDYQSAVSRISTMSKKERLEMTANFTSLQKLADKADKELEEIGANATSEANFREAYAKYIEKYNGKLITNKYDAEDLTLYVPDGDNMATYLINENKKIVIGNEIKQISLDNDMGYSEKAVFAIDESATIAPAATYPNTYSFKQTAGSKKTTGSVEILTSSCVETHVGCQKKLWYGWKRDNAREVYIQLNASPMYYTYTGPHASSGQPPIQVSYIQFFAFENNGDITYPTGGMKPGTTILTGNLKVWTDLTVETTTTSYTNVYMDKDKNLGTYTLPTCNPAKAYGGDFKLEYIRP